MAWFNNDRCKFFFSQYRNTSLNFYEIIKNQIIQNSRNYYQPVATAVV